MTERYMGKSHGVEAISELLQDVNLDIIFALYNLDVTPSAETPLAPGIDMGRLWPRHASLPEMPPGQGGAPSMAYVGEAPRFDFDADAEKLPTGAIQIDTIRIRFKTAGSGGSRL